jgi:hypothetical protein
MPAVDNVHVHRGQTLVTVDPLIAFENNNHIAPLLHNRKKSKRFETYTLNVGN